ncbi:hypothetical protein CMI47_06385 [Candidatus Pacearchaeota archaeon]|nr:hypothetical protein [Candidatus Pacearchaeota archaeon]
MGGTRFTNAKGVESVVVSNGISATSGTTWDSGAMAVPANSIITDLGVVVTSALGLASGVLGTMFGSSAGGEQYAAEDDNSLSTAVTSLAVGKGVNTVATETTSMGGATAIVVVADSAFSASARDVHGRLTAGGTITGGTVRFWVKYRVIA